MPIFTAEHLVDKELKTELEKILERPALCSGAGLSLSDFADFGYSISYNSGLDFRTKIMQNGETFYSFNIAVYNVIVSRNAAEIKHGLTAQAFDINGKPLYGLVDFMPTAADSHIYNLKFYGYPISRGRRIKLYFYHNCVKIAKFKGLKIFYE